MIVCDRQRQRNPVLPAIREVVLTGVHLCVKQSINEKPQRPLELASCTSAIPSLPPLEIHAMIKKRPPDDQPKSPAPIGPIELSPNARALVDRVSSEWSLTVPVKALLRLIAENMTRAELCDEILAREGLVVPDAKGASKVHPLALLARDHRNAASNGLQRLLSNLEG